MKFALKFPALKPLGKQFSGKQWRNWAIGLHGSLGLVTGLLLLLIGLSGSVIVFAQELDETLNPTLFQVQLQAEQVSLDTMQNRVQTERPDLPLWFITVPQTPDKSYVFNQKLPHDRRWQTFVDPYTGNILGSRLWEQSIVGFFYALHHDLFSGTIGQVVVGITGVCLLFISISGIFLWTGWRKLLSGLKIRWQAEPSLLRYDLHQVTGIFSGTFLLIIAVTGIIIVALHLLPIFGQDSSQNPVPETPSLALSELVKKSNSALPEGKISLIEFSEENPANLTIRKKLLTQETGRFDLSSVEINRQSGEILSVSKIEKPQGLFALIVVTAAFHFGTFGGLPTRILYVFLGLMPIALLLTGLSNWKRRRLLLAKRHSTQKLSG